MAPFTFLRNKTCRIILSLIIAVQAVNFSIDAADPFPHGEDLAMNDIESCIELIMEVVLDHENAIEETEDSDHSTHKTGTGINLFSISGGILTFCNPFELLAGVSRPAPSFLFRSLSRSVTSPPPRTA